MAKPADYEGDSKPNKNGSEKRPESVSCDRLTETRRPPCLTTFRDIPDASIGSGVH
jgi:hypothetical protein